jgi:hypothetical protein
MSASGNSINYDLRTAKSVERRMISTTVKELFKVVKYKSRRYIGMGSTYFTDFKLFHKELHIDNMISIELEESLKKRVEFNKPFSSIKIKIGKTTDVLPFLEWNLSNDFVWMDYDEKLQYDYFNDIEIIFSNISLGSIYIMTCNKQLNNYSGNIEYFKEKFGELVPNGISNIQFNGEKDMFLIRQMLLNKINQVLKYRNYTLPEEEHLIFRQLFFFVYKDGAPMISYGGYVDLKNNPFDLSNFNLDKFDFIKTSDEFYRIDPPIITHKEISLLNSCLPSSIKKYNNTSKINFIPEKDRKNFKELYKFLPTYMDVLY